MVSVSESGEKFSTFAYIGGFLSSSTVVFFWFILYTLIVQAMKLVHRLVCSSDTAHYEYLIPSSELEEREQKQKDRIIKIFAVVIIIILCLGSGPLYYYCFWKYLSKYKNKYKHICNAFVHSPSSCRLDLFTNSYAGGGQ